MDRSTRTTIIQRCQGNLHQAARLIYGWQERRRLIAHRLSQPWPEEQRSFQDEVAALREEVGQLADQVKGKKVLFQPVAHVTPTPTKPSTPRRGIIEL